ncbi:MAG: PepSY domain-containing protein [Snowella sp.]|nr:PepSY domain-containing protein [Snowella sp.]
MRVPSINPESASMKCLLALSSLTLLMLTVSASALRADDDRDVTPQEKAQIEQVLRAMGCNFYDDADFEGDRQRYDLSDVICNDGKKYDMYLDQSFKVIYKREDRD